MKATVLAHPNIALVKYWGKRDDALILPHQSSLSLTLSPLSVTTTVEFGVPTDAVELNGHVAKGSERERVLRLLESVRAQAGDKSLGPAKVVSRGDFPMAAGLASSAAGFAALAVAGRAAAGLPRDTKAESILARLGSGSACRSVQGGFCEWQRGERPDGDDSFAVQRFDAAHWPELRMVVAILDRGEKDVKSRDGMKQAVETSPYYAAWVKDAEAEVPRAREYIARRDLQALGEMCERNAWRMHSTSLAADPPLCYLNAATVGLIHHLREHRKKGVPVWFTLDAGPNPVLLTDAANEVAAEALARACGALDVIRCVPGGDATLKSEHLF
ncbi:diphosphomevalonate decarboxylase [Myxococcus sp. MISCRS1]|jgi:diphosphomevalonate decarboxylase|uniref:diphosphomevalonate decarboxylase n=1 Tax=Myxococcus TaxID=32 RepID=UPI0011417710|nr:MULTISPECIES: diphosphomevalonate decarboxylase [Myxococcus]BDT36155.1 diphosphomevalonate decarboxylase [Myxococcus sp. MH1]MBZ4398817.1 diphosphomevalonate decarboxylase [Myxococcus sp. AS-1-15]MBZ4407077.1 diphosphomevalonate decarboxylase [Myxococcus sp. XM-1-1-1]MCK8500611.1 diphosphomevalonate decarboxylase [Myxococcus fulvus]MCY1002273.1 diphosphomevalonate decarboxylase [Myxococcus sp. MISCRS1]